MSERVVRTDPDVVFRRLGEDMVLLHLATNEIYELNDTAARLWELLAQDGNVESAAVRLAEEYEVDPAQLRREVETTIARFRTEDLLREDGDV